jgi:hypothetical protein
MSSYSADITGLATQAHFEEIWYSEYTLIFFTQIGQHVLP